MTLIPRFRLPPLWVVLLLGSLPACHGERATTHVHEASPQGPDSRQFRALDRVLRVAIDTLWSVGGLHDERVSLTTLHPSNLLSDGQQRLYVLDVVARQVHVVNMRGDLIATWGGVGPGPGELMRPRYLGEDDENGVAAVDFGKGAVVAWTADGDLLPERSFLEAIQGPIHRSGAGDKAIDVFVTRTLERRSRMVEKLRITDSSGTMTIASITLPPMTLASFPSCGMRDVHVPPLLSPRLVWDYRRGTTVVSDGVGYRLEVYDGGTRRTTITRNLPPVAVDGDMARAYLGESVELARCVITTDELLGVAGFQGRIPTIKRLTLAKGRRLYVTRTTPDLASRVDLVSLDSGYIGTLPSGTPTPDAFLRGNEFVSIEQDSLGVPILSAYRVRVAESD